MENGPVTTKPATASTSVRSVGPLRGADVLVEALVRAGVAELFGVPGDTGVVFYDALARRDRDIRHVLARDERHAAAMADAYARARGCVGVVEVSSGGGTTYVVGGLGEAYAASTPVLVLTSDIHRDSGGTGALTEIDQRALFAAVTKNVLVADSAADLPAMVAEALTLATSGRPGPVAVVVPEDVLDEQVDALADEPLFLAIDTPRHRARADNGAVARVAELLARAERPAFLVGGGVHYSGAYDELADLAQALGAGVATSIHGKGAIADQSPWALGVTGNNGGGPLARQILSEADVVVVVGSRANATDTDSYTAPARSARVIGIDLDPSRIVRNYPDAVTLRGDAKTVLKQLCDAVPELDTAVKERRRENIAVLRDRHRSRPMDPPQASSSRPWSNQPSSPPAPGQLAVDDVIDTLAGVLANLDAVVVADPGAPTPAVAARYPVHRAGRSLVIPRGHGPMGYAIPAAIGVAMARPGRPVLALTADGSFAMSCGELETIARLALPIVAVQLTNHSLGWIKMLQHLYQGQRYFGVDPGDIDAVGVARACGLRAARPQSIAELNDHVYQAVADRFPVYLDIEVPHMIDVVPQVPAWHRALSGDRTRPVY